MPSSRTSPRRRAARTLALLGLVAGALLAPAGSAGAAELRSTPYRNPVLDRDFPDPTVIRAADGWYYAYGTQHDFRNRRVNVQVARSRDLVHWRYLGEALPRLPEWADDEPVSWAPHVIRAHGRYYLYHSIVPDELAADFGLCLAVATSESPAGPFRHAPEPLFCGDTLADIDLAVIKDPKSGKWYGYWGSGGDIHARRLAGDLTRFAPHAPDLLLLRGWSAQVRRPYEHGIEGPWVTYRRGWYYLFYSGDRCCEYPGAHYAVMVARSRRPIGPFQRFGAAHGQKSSVILHRNARFAGPGHNSVIRDAAGQDWMVYHAIDTRRPLEWHGGVRRVMMIDRIVYRDGWPRIRHDVPSVRWQRHGPVTLHH